MAAGSPFLVGGPGGSDLRGPHLRVTAGLLRDDADAVGTALADAARAV